MEISVIIPTYKPQPYLWECLDSLCNQSFLKNDYEILLVLNGCCEPYNSQIKEYIRQHPDVQWNYIQTDEGGVSNARNIGLDNAKGEYITFIDDDDYVSNTYLESLHEHADGKTVAISCAYAFEDKTGKSIPYGITNAYNKIVVNGRYSPIKSRRYFNGPCMKLIHRNIIDTRRYDKGISNGEDGLFMFIISDRISYFQKASSNAIYYRRLRSGSLVSKNRSRIEKLTNSGRIIWKEINAIAANPFRYNWYLFIRSMMGLIKSGVID